MTSLVVLAVLLAGPAQVEPVSNETAAVDPLPALRARQVVVRAAVEAVLPSIVRIDTIGGAALKRDAQVQRFRQADGPTTGLIVGADGWILTSSFNFVRNPSVITVRLHDGRRLIAELVARDHVAKLALLKVAAENLPVPTYAEPDAIRPGRISLAAGYGHGSETPSVAVGIVSAAMRMDGIALQSDARVSPASYGGPLIDRDGRVLGILVPLATGGDELAGAEWYDSGIAFAVRRDFFEPRLERMQQGENLFRGLMGVFLDMNMPIVGGDDAPVAGRKLTGPASGPARAAGLQEGDILTAIDGQACPTPVATKRILARLTPGDTIEVRYWRDGVETTAALTLMSTEQLRAAAAEEAVAESAADESGEVESGE